MIPESEYYTLLPSVFKDHHRKRTQSQLRRSSRSFVILPKINGHTPVSSIIACQPPRLSDPNWMRFEQPPGGRRLVGTWSEPGHDEVDHLQESAWAGQSM